MALLESSHVPVCTYRVQLNGRFTFNDLGGLLPYFTSLGVTDFYLSPIFSAVPGSLHGYDVTDYCKINPEIGGGDGFDLLTKRLRGADCDVVLDFVPNHMGIAGMLNRWWCDVLENGRMSPYARFFDIHWKEAGSAGRPRVLVPILEDHYGKILEQGKITLVYQDGFSLKYYDVCLPISPSSYARILEPIYLKKTGGEDYGALVSAITEFADLPKPAGLSDVETARKRADAVEHLKSQIVGFIGSHPKLQERLTERLKEINGVAGVPDSFNELHALIEKQHYRLARWKTGAHEINYRRFFAIDTLVGLHMEKSDVFRECHELLGRLVREGKVAGLRIDHIDGLRQPEDYLQRLQTLDRPDASKPLYVVVEKILAREEVLPERWQAHGTTGYEFIAQLSAALVNPATAGRIDEIYRSFTGDHVSYADTIYEKKRQIIAELFVNAVSNLGAELVEILAEDRRWRDLTRHELTTVVSELMAAMPVYRTYRRRLNPVSPPDRRVLEEACARALMRNPRADPEPFHFVRDLLIGIYPSDNAPENFRDDLLSWVLTFQQYTGAVMAKAVEDTAFYTYNRLVALNEVGGDPGFQAGSIDEFHRINGDRLARSPHSLLATSTHDTKMSEDVRARLYALSELPDEWENWLREWKGLAEKYTTIVDGAPAPDAQDIYRLLQVLLGAWPLDQAQIEDTFRKRLREYFRKAVSEAKLHTSYLQNNVQYLDACDRFVDGLLNVDTASAFLASFVPAAQRISRLGMVNSLTQVILKCTSPGVPDFYQGNEIWDFSLVDPDNRRDVDYALRQRMLDAAGASTFAALLENWRDGTIKLRVTQMLLKFRAENRHLFSHGEYQPILAEGIYADHVIAFRRTWGNASLLVAVPRLTAKLGTPPVGPMWDDTRLPALDDAGTWRDLFSGRILTAKEPLYLRNLFTELPFAVVQRT
ncbi:MAG: malto-oligosyltrehalose synthase [Nibricoccus sp.]